MTGPDAMKECCQRAREAARQWRQRPVTERLRFVAAFRRLLADAADELAAAVARDVSKSTAEVLGGEVLPLAEACRFLQREAPGLLRPRRVPGRSRPIWLWGQKDVVHRRPRGIIGIIGTWNYPLFLNGVQILQAVTAGNAVVWKPSEVAPASAAALAGLLRRAAFPPGLVEVLETTRDAGAALLEAPIDHVVLTGSAATGRIVARRLGERLVSSTMELSGCDPLFVLHDADVELAARAAWFGATLNAGQTCVAARRAFVHRPLYAPFCEIVFRLSAKAAPVRLAMPAQAEQAGHLIADAVARGGRLLTSGPPQEPNCDFPPTAVADARPEMLLCQEASFAPLLAVLPFDDSSELVRMNQACPYHLGAAIFTRTPRAAFALADDLRSGVVTINDVIAPTAHPATPFGGRGESGWGVTQGAEGLLEMTVPQVVSRRSGRFRPHYQLAAGQATPETLAVQEDLLRGLLESGHAQTWRRRWRGWWRFLRAAWRMSS
jgi:acyl-CoA reductase-like NAD-dependent aldehyde dehydrogenase